MATDCKMLDSPVAVGMFFAGGFGWRRKMVASSGCGRRRMVASSGVEIRMLTIEKSLTSTLHSSLSFSNCGCFCVAVPKMETSKSFTRHRTVLLSRCGTFAGVVFC